MTDSGLSGITVLDELLKEYYVGDDAVNVAIEDTPLLAMIKKNEKASGEHAVMPVLYGNPQNRAAVYATAYGRSATLQAKKFTFDWVQDFSLDTIETLTIRASGGNASFLDVAEAKVRGVLKTLARSKNIDLYGDGNGALGTIGTLNSDNIIMARKNDARKFDVGMVVAFAETAGGTLRDSGDTLTVSAVDVDAGKVTFSAATSGIASIATGDSVIPEGDNGVKLYGVEGWCPPTAPGSGDSFGGVDRSANPTKLAGQRLDGTGMSTYEALGKAAAKLGNAGKKATHAFMDHFQFNALLQQAAGKAEVAWVEANPTVGFEGMKVRTPAGTITVVPDGDCPADRIFLCDLKALELHSLGKCIGLLDDGDQGKLVRKLGSDAYVIEAGFYGQLLVRDTAAICNIQVSVQS